MKTYSCHLCSTEWNKGEIAIQPDGSYGCPGCGYPFYAIRNDSDNANTTRWIENDPWGCHYWECEQCKSDWSWDGHPKDHDIKYCPACGREIVEFVDWVDPLDHEPEECITPERPYCPSCKYGLIEYPEWVETHEDTFGCECKWICTLGVKTTNDTKV